MQQYFAAHLGPFLQSAGPYPIGKRLDGVQPSDSTKDEELVAWKQITSTPLAVRYCHLAGIHLYYYFAAAWVFESQFEGFVQTN